MKKVLIIVAVAILTIALAGCSSSKESRKYQDKQFEVVSEENMNAGQGDRLIIVRHKQSDKQFLIYKGMKKGGIVSFD